MAFEEVPLGEFLASKREASDFLVRNTSRDRNLSYNEALILQAARHILQTSDTLTERDVLELTQQYGPEGHRHGGTGMAMRRFVELDVFNLDEQRPAASGAGNPPHVYRPTELGTRVIEFFQAYP